MPDEATNDDTQTDDGSDSLDNLPKVRAALKREQARREAAEAQAAGALDAQRQLAFIRAGGDLDGKVGQLAFKAYDGELEPEAITTYLKDIPGAMRETTPPPGETPPPSDGPTDEERRQAAAQAALSGEGPPPGTTPPKPLGQEIMDEAFAAQGGSRVRPTQGMSDRAMAAGLQVLVSRAVEGDPEAVFKRPEESWGAATDRWRNTHPR